MEDEDAAVEPVRIVLAARDLQPVHDQESLCRAIERGVGNALQGSQRGGSDAVYVLSRRDQRTGVDGLPEGEVRRVQHAGAAAALVAGDEDAHERVANVRL